MHKKFFFILRLLIWLAPLFILAYIIYLQANPLGLPREYTKIPGKKHKLISELEPKERVKLPQKNASNEEEQELTGKLVYFSASNFKKNQEVSIQVTFNTDLNEANLGILKSRQQEADFEVRPIYNDFLENLNWERIQEGGTTLYQREKKFASVAEFLVNPPLDQTRTIYYQNKDFDFKPLVEKNLGGINYILTYYQRVENLEGGWMRNLQKFKVDNYYLDDDSLRFVFVLPEIEKGYFKIKKIKVLVDEPASNFLKKLKNIF